MRTKLKATDAAWLAGYVDGDGCIKILRQINPYGRPTHHAVLDVLSIDREQLEWAQSIFGGFIQTRDTNANWSRQYRWVICAKKLVPVLEELLPYLRIKRPQALIALELQHRAQSLRASRHHPVSDEEIAWRDQQKALISTHNQRHRPQHPSKVDTGDG